jgi:hypothetical protein
MRVRTRRVDRSRARQAGRSRGRGKTRFLEPVQFDPAVGFAESFAPCGPACGRDRTIDEQGAAMSPAPDTNEDVPFMQKLLDNPFLLLFLGVMVPMVLYTAWGVWDILTLPVAK